MIEIFNQPLHKQPLGTCEMGSGDGTLLAHLYSIVQQRTARGRVLDRHPLIVVGADFNAVARCATTRTLRAAGIPVSHVIHGDINRPAQLASDLAALDHDVHDLLHVRSFLDHSRPYARIPDFVSGSRTLRTSSALAHLGADIPADERIEQESVDGSPGTPDNTRGRRTRESKSLLAPLSPSAKRRPSR